MEMAQHGRRAACFAVRVNLATSILAGGVFHQVNAGPGWGTPEERPAQPLFQRSRIRHEERLRHVLKAGLINHPRQANLLPFKIGFRQSSRYFQQRG